MDRPSGVRFGAIAAGLFGLVFVFSLTPIRSYDYYWHLATGRWIVEHGALPESDPFALASDRGPWINGEWVFEVALYGVRSLVGETGVTIVKAGTVGLLFVALLAYLARAGSIVIALLVALVSWLGAAHRLDARPETAGVMLLPIAIGLMLEEPSKWRTALLGLITIVWINVHPSALLVVPVLGLIVIGDLVVPLDPSRQIDGDHDCCR